MMLVDANLCNNVAQQDARSGARGFGQPQYLWCVVNQHGVMLVQP
jgi:hypothetical protein